MIPPGGTRGDALQQAGPLPNVGGQRWGHNIYLLDGVKVTDELFNNLVISPSVDSIQEFKIQKTMYPAEFGGKASALINVVTQAGRQRVARQRCSSSTATTRSTRTTTSTDGRSRCRRCARTSSAVTLGGPIVAGSQLLLFQLRRAADAPGADADVLGADGRASRRRFLGPGGALRSADRRGRAAPARRLPATGFRRAASIRLPRRSWQRCRCRPAAAWSRTSSAVEEQVDPTEPVQRPDRPSPRRDDDQYSARFTTFHVDETQPFGTSSLHEALVPGFGRTVTTQTRERGARPHPRVRLVAG